MTNRTLSILLVAAAAAAGCGSDDDAPQASATATASPARAAAPYGTYVREVSKADLERTESRRDEYGPHQQLPPSGRYTLVIAKGAAQDVLKVSDPDAFTVGMDLVAEEDLLRLTSYVNPEEAAFCGPEIPASGRYGFSVSGSELTLEPRVDDPCADRDSILTGTWRKP